jgi:hypothetical protein
METGSRAAVKCRQLIGIGSPTFVFSAAFCYAVQECDARKVEYSVESLVNKI